MKKFVTAALLVLGTGVRAMTADEEQFCKTLTVVAVSTMDARQAGVPFLEVLELQKSVPEELQGVLRSMAELAYETPRYTSREYQDRAVRDFSNDWAVQCYKSAK